MKIASMLNWGITVVLAAALSGCGGSSGSTGGTEPAALQTQAMVSGGGGHTLMVKEDGTVWSWGDNSRLQLGLDTTASPVVPAQPILTDVATVAAGGTHSLALKKDGTVWGWGDATYGQAGDPSLLGGIVDPGSISITGGSIALNSRQYSADSILQIGNSGNTPPVNPGIILKPPVLVVLQPMIMIPRQITGLSGVIAVAAGTDHSLALKNDGTVWAWGRNTSGQLGAATTGDQSVAPVKVSCPDGITAIAAGRGHSAALRKDGTVWVWGDNTYGQAGAGSGGTSLPPRQVTGLVGIVAIASGGDHLLALTRDGALWGWGRNSSGQLGIDTTTDSAEPVRIPLPEPVLGIAGGGSHSVAVTKSGHVWVWGGNASWQGGGDGYEAQILAPRMVPGVASVKAVAAGAENTLVVKEDGTYLGWGNNVFGQLGDGTRGDRRKPVVIAAPVTGTIIAGGDWGGRDLTPRDGDVLTGTFTNVGKFVIGNGDAVGYGPGKVVISAVSFDFDGSLYAVPPNGRTSLTLNATAAIDIHNGSALGYSDGTIVFTTGAGLVNLPGNEPGAGGGLIIRVD